MKKMKPRTKVLIAFLLIAAVIYNAAANFMVSAALIPSFMRKLEAFESVTEKSYSELIRTDEITENIRKAREETAEFIESTEMRKVKCVSDDGYDLIAAVFKQEEPEGRPWVILLHGYTGWKEEMYHFAARYYEKGFNILVPDLRCQGESEGDYIGMGWTDREDVRKWIGMILESYPGSSIVLHGESMGASCALITAGDQDDPIDQIACVISDCAYTDAMSMFSKQLKDWFGLPDPGLVSTARIWLMIRGGYDLKDADCLSCVRKTRTPTLFIQGDSDKIVPKESAETLYAACAAGTKDLMVVEGAGHAQSCYKDPDAYYDRVFGFIDSIINNK